MSATKTAVKRQKIGPWQEAWLQTLESGWFRQTKEVLGRLNSVGEYSFCCLGMACEVAIENGTRLQLNEEFGDIAYGSQTGHLCDTALPVTVRQLMRFRDDEGVVDFESLPTESLKAACSAALGHCGGLASMNDSGWAFARIAAFVRKYPEAVFSGPA